jgi:hypothetical protein
VVITASSLSWSRAYAFTSYPTNSGTMTYNVQDAGCGGWNVTLVATNFVYTGPNSGSPIAASNLTLTGSTLPSGTGITRPATSGPLNSAINILRATAPNGNGTFSQTLNLNLNVPAGVIVGQYQSVVTIAVAAGP